MLDIQLYKHELKSKSDIRINSTIVIYYNAVFK